MPVVCPKNGCRKNPLDLMITPVGAVVGGTVRIAAALGASFGIGATQEACSPNDRKPEDDWDRYFAEAKGSNDGGPSAADAAVSEDAGPADGGVDGGMSVDSGPTTPVDGGENLDGGMSTPDSGNPDVQTPDAGENLPPQRENYTCYLSVQEDPRWGTRFGGVLSGEVGVSLDGRGFGGNVYFQAPAGSYGDALRARQEDPAQTWPRAGQSIPPEASSLTGHYRISRAIDPRNPGTTNYVSIESYPAGGASRPGDGTIVPMTTERNGNPTPIERLTGNEGYVFSPNNIQISVTCDQVGARDHFRCRSFEGVLESGFLWGSMIFSGMEEVVNMRIRCESDIPSDPL